MPGVDDDQAQPIDPDPDRAIKIRPRPARQARVSRGDQQLIDVRAQRPVNDAALLRPDARKQQPMSARQVPPRQLTQPLGSLDPWRLRASVLSP